jgi:predicted RNA-binding protein
MCESSVFINKSGELEEVMREVAKIDVFENKVICIGLLGDTKQFEGMQIVEANFIEHRIVLGKIK